ncbi:inter-alpha-trypsin inhibitor heavy chain H3-like [Girardinichthys multiradiatus]|uniref:inter-alpha-trypsin inhibitor heavy chain H3-like n=1 Tax=Girardinichthys multiradiatus TaxID=208333 RepID=UPI001FAB8735|nr:inter-alpha-trypsin inhibitor heavy chain H3-like [Girardinichthys multiradiatus]
MRRAVVQLPLFGLLMAVVAAIPNKDDWDIYSFHINSTVTGRYATTIITSRVANRMDESREIEFHVQIPKNAFISRFTMFIDGQVYDGVVKTKEQAQQQYTAAVSRGQSAGIVSSVGRTMEEFKTSVNVAAHKKVTFELTYEELLKRTHGKYEMLIHARPMKPVKDFKVDVYIYEKAGISFIDVKGGLSTKALANAITKTHAEKQAWVYFYPTEDQQKSCDSCGEEGMNGDLIIVYEVNRDNGLGDIKTSDGYFVHHFAPSNLPRIPKNVVFVIDQSGSMHGRKIQQTRTALHHILNDLAEEDFFGLISFDSAIFHWKRELVQATTVNLEGAKEFARNIKDRGATDINAAVLEGARMLNAHPRQGSASILILLTDGDPTSGVTDLEMIQSNVKQAIADKFPLYCLGFGFDVNFGFLAKMSMQNNGVARRIYEDSDADLQLKGFYEEVATPLLIDVEMIYLGGTNLTQTNFSQYYNGSEIVVAGEIIDNNIETFTPQVVAISQSERKVTFSNTNRSVDSSTETVAEGLLQRIWAYLTVKQLLEKELLLSGPEKEKVKGEALELSLKYNFVTPLTSMVVTKPDGENTEVLHKPKEGESQKIQSYGGSSYSFSQGYGGSSYSFSQGRYDTTGFTLNHHIKITMRFKQCFPKHVTWQVTSEQVLLVGRFTQTSTNPARSAAHRSSLLFDSAGVPALGGAPGPSGRIGLPEFGILRGRFGYVRPTSTPGRSASVTHRFLVKTENQSTPLCFDINGTIILKLLDHPSKEVYVNGELDSVTNGGFSRIFIHAGSDQHVEVEPDGFRQGRSAIHQPANDSVTTGRITVLRHQYNEFDIAVEDVRLVILVHEKDGNRFLWAVLRQRPLANNIKGILALKPADYEEIVSSPSTKLKIKDREIIVISSTADDYSIIKPVLMRCWLTSTRYALEKPLNDYIAAQL